MNATLRQTLQRPCLIERTEGVIVVEPLQFIPLRHVRGFNKDDRQRRGRS
jgi:hypothetical protein